MTKTQYLTEKYEEKYLYRTQTFYKDQAVVGETELFAPEIYGGNFLGIITEGVLITGHKNNGEFVSDDYQGLHMCTPTSETLLFAGSASEAQKTEDNFAIIRETRGYLSPRAACCREGQRGPTQIAHFSRGNWLGSVPAHRRITRSVEHGRLHP
ncbi:MAG: hypothetical protein SPL08_03925, partial [Pseudomonadota bacterium]|nr:hypothetical protein [Pseudomonadota bacterium]